jgi:hypothetical protein
MSSTAPGQNVKHTTHAVQALQGGVSLRLACGLVSLQPDCSLPSSATRGAGSGHSGLVLATLQGCCCA